MTVKERLQRVVSEMSEEEAADALALVAGARGGATPSDIFGTAWGKVPADVYRQVLPVTDSAPFAAAPGHRGRTRLRHGFAAPCRSDT